MPSSSRAPKASITQSKNVGYRMSRAAPILIYSPHHLDLTALHFKSQHRIDDVIVRRTRICPSNAFPGFRNIGTIDHEIVKDKCAFQAGLEGVDSTNGSKSRSIPVIEQTMRFAAAAIEGRVEQDQAGNPYGRRNAEAVRRNAYSFLASLSERALEPIDMRHGWQRNRRYDLTGFQHEGGWVIQGKMFAGGRSQDCWRKRAKLFALLDECVDPVLHLRPTRVGENGSRAKRTRSEFHPAGHPRDYLPPRPVCRQRVQSTRPGYRGNREISRRRNSKYATSH